MKSPKEAPPPSAARETAAPATAPVPPRAPATAAAPAAAAVPPSAPAKAAAPAELKGGPDIFSEEVQEMLKQMGWVKPVKPPATPQAAPVATTKGADNPLTTSVDKTEVKGPVAVAEKGQATARQGQQVGPKAVILKTGCCQFDQQVARQPQESGRVSRVAQDGVQRRQEVGPYHNAV